MYADIDTQDYIDEIVDNIRKKDRIKADLVIAHIAQMGADVQRKMLQALARENTDFTVSYIIHLLEIASTLDIEEDEIIETLQDMLLQRPQNIRFLLENPVLSDKFDIIDLIAELQYDGAVPYLLERLNNEQDQKSIIRIIRALGSIGDPEAVTSLSEYLYSENRPLIMAAIDALKEIASSNAIEALTERIGTDHEIDVKIVDIFALIQDEACLKALNRVLKTGDPILRNYAKTKLIQIGPKVVPVIIDNLRDDDSEFVIHSLNILGMLGDASAVNAIRQLLFDHPPNGNVRFAAFEALGMLPILKGIFVLSNGLSDEVDLVRKAAARAIDRNNTSMLRSGIRNLIRKGDAEARNIVSAFIDAEADSIFRNMIMESPFKELAMDYLIRDAHPDLKKHFGDLLRQIGYSDLAQEIVPQAEDDRKRLNIIVVDDSRMLLKVYKSNLHDIGYASRLFEFPETALEHILAEKPDLVITDLNMPKLTGIQLTERIREKYPAGELPILLITTQTDQDETATAYKAGISDVIYKPFTKEQLKKTIDKLVG
ncbi:MAG TPA: response regulator [Caldithrix abyssi]|uniref:Response regulator n=1 Tax=Caldithrix abyssi TaxID=187145 RepID=A0A7V1LJY1_CALAY|nr:response regulator [Caldithrix abyssi]